MREQGTHGFFEQYNDPNLEEVGRKFDLLKSNRREISESRFVAIEDRMTELQTRLKQRDYEELKREDFVRRLLKDIQELLGK